MSQEIGAGPRQSLQTITYAIQAYTLIDKIIYVKYEAKESNPIWGQFFKFAQTPSVYSSAQTVVEIRYASHLNETWRRFVVCKELCHALDADDGVHSVTDRSIDKLLNKFALMSTNQSAGRPFAPFTAELLAEVGAIELLCPIDFRRNIVKQASCNANELCEEFGIPTEYSELAFAPEYIDIIESLL